MMYALMKLVDGQEKYFTGEHIKAGPQMSKDIGKAKVFPSARSAYAFAGMSPHFRWVRAARTEYTHHEDGFKSRWWVK
mgnify:CR=1 FL=1